jgi:hypothetical protein
MQGIKKPKDNKSITCHKNTGINNTNNNNNNNIRDVY